MLPELAGRKTWDTSAIYDTGLIGVIAMIDGDTDDDRDIDTDDYDAFLAAFGGTGDRWTDFNEDGLSDLADFVLMRTNFDLDFSPSPALDDPDANAPEPTTLILLAGGLPILLKRKRKS